MLYVIWALAGSVKYTIDYDYNSIQFNSILYYLCAESTATRPITETALRRYYYHCVDTSNYITEKETHK
jgi:hypothetical protein